MRHCEHCEFLGTSGYECPESYCTVGVQEDDPKFDEDKEGCGCHYNLRTLRKMERKNERAEYFAYLGYTDYSLMPTMEYTDENKKVLEKHLNLMRHAIGMDNRKTYVRHGKKFYRPYRNYFQTNERTVDYPYWERMVKAGIAEKEVDEKMNIWYSLNRTGLDYLGLHDGIHIYDEED